MIESIGQYKILEELGSGGFGTVFLARDKTTGVMVAIKVLNPEISASPEFRQRFLREADALRSLPTHPNIVRLLNYVDEHGVPYLVMDYLTGKDLRDVMAGSNLPVRQAVIYAVQVARALEAAALGGLVHCDIKPENLRILHDGSLMVMDFGIARAADASFRETAGTPSYMAPELWWGEVPGPAVDVYALGCVLYEMIIGTPPFQSSEVDTKIWRQKLAAWHKNLEPDWRPLQMMNLPASFIGLLKSLLAKQPSARPAVRLVREELEEYAESLPVDARLTANLKLVSDARSHLLEELSPDETFVRTDDENTILHTPLDLATNPSFSSKENTTPPHALERIGTGDQVYVQRHLASIDLGVDACRSALVYQGNLICGNLNGELVTLDLQTGRVGRYNLGPRSTVVSATWGMAIHADRLLLHMGGMDWLEVNSQTGQRYRSGRFPEAGLSLLTGGDWLYGHGGKKLYRWPVSDPGQRADEFSLPGRAAGSAVLERGSVYLPTSFGLVRLPPGSDQVEPIGPQEPARVVIRLGGRRIVALYPIISKDGSLNTRLRWYETTPETRLLGEMTFAGQTIGSPQVADNWLMLAFQDGRLIGCQFVENSLQEGWETRIGGGRTLQAGLAYGSGLVAAVSSNQDGGILSVVHAQKGEIVHEQPVLGDFLIPPLWWERKIVLVNGAGSLEVFRISI